MHQAASVDAGIEVAAPGTQARRPHRFNSKRVALSGQAAVVLMAEASMAAPGGRAAALSSPRGEGHHEVEDGAIAHGYLIGTTGAVPPIRQLHTMRRDGLDREMATRGIGGGEGIASADGVLRAIVPRRRHGLGVVLPSGPMLGKAMPDRRAFIPRPRTAALIAAGPDVVVAVTTLRHGSAAPTPKLQEPSPEPHFNRPRMHEGSTREVRPPVSTVFGSGGWMPSWFEPRRDRTGVEIACPTSPTATP
jgi:hypothetical protein